MHIVPFYAALLALVFVAFSVRAIRLRQRLRVAIGDGGDERLRRAARVHSNVSQVPEPRSLRVIGMALTFVVLVAAALRLLSTSLHAF